MECEDGGRISKVLVEADESDEADWLYPDTVICEMELDGEDGEVEKVLEEDHIFQNSETIVDDEEEEERKKEEKKE